MKKIINRRNFIKSLGLLTLAPVIQSCESSITGYTEGTPRERPVTPRVDILLDGTEEEIAAKIQDKHTVLQELYDNPGKELTLGFLQDRNYNVLKITFIKDTLASYPHLRLVNSKTNEVANLLWGRDGVYPTIKFVDDAGNVIIRNGKALEFPIKISEKLNKINSPVDWIIMGIKVFAVALLLWIGFSIAKYVASALAFIAFNAMAIGLVLAGLGIIVELIQWILNRTNIQFDDITDFFRNSIAGIVNTLLDVVNYVINYFSGI